MYNRRLQLSFHGTARLVKLCFIKGGGEPRGERQLHVPPRTKTSARSCWGCHSGTSRRKRVFWRDKDQRGSLSSFARRVGKEISIRRAELNNSDKNPFSHSFNAGTQFVSFCAMRTAHRALLFFTWIRVHDGLILGLSLSSYLTPFDLRASILLLNREMSAKVKLTFVPLRIVEIR